MTVHAIEFKTEGYEETTIDYEIFENLKTWLRFKKECLMDNIKVTALEVVCIHITNSEYNIVCNGIKDAERLAENAIDSAMKRIFK